MATLFLNSDALVKFTNKLEQLSHTAMPNIVRKTLNDAALDVKQKTMPQAATVFKHRQQNFFTATSRVEFAKNTHNINEMQSTVGFMDKGLKGENNYSIKDLIQQEDGGTIKGRSFIALPIARSGNSFDGLVLPRFRLTEINKLVINAATFKGKTDKEKFTLAAIFVGKGGYVIGCGLDRSFIFKINSVHRVRSSDKGRTGWTVINKTPIYAVKSQRIVTVHETNFMQKASFVTQGKLESIYIANAKTRIEKELS